MNLNDEYHKYMAEEAEWIRQEISKDCVDGENHYSYVNLQGGATSLVFSSHAGLADYFVMMERLSRLKPIYFLQVREEFLYFARKLSGKVKQLEEELENFKSETLYLAHEAISSLNKVEDAKSYFDLDIGGGVGLDQTVINYAQEVCICYPDHMPSLCESLLKSKNLSCCKAYVDDLRLLYDPDAFPFLELVSITLDS